MKIPATAGASVETVRKIAVDRLHDGCREDQQTAQDSGARQAETELGAEQGLEGAKRGRIEVDEEMSE
jgi:hypothetical protein